MLAAKFFLTIFIARYMGLEEVGIYGLIVATSGTVQCVLRGGVFNIMARDSVHQSVSELTGHLRYYITGILCLYAVLFPAAYALGFVFNHTELALLALGIFLTEHFAFDLFILVNNLLKPKLANVLLCLQSASWIYLYIGLAFFLQELRNLETMLMFWVTGGVATLSFALFLSRKWPWKAAFTQPIRWSWYKNYIGRAKHIYIADVVSVIALYMDRYFITLFLGLKLTGVYILFAQVESAIVNLVTSGVMQVYVPRLIAAYKEKNMGRFWSVFKNSAARTLGSTALLGLLSALALPVLIQWTDKPEAVRYLPLFWLMMAVLLIRMSGQLARSLFYPMHMDKENLRLAIVAMIGTAIAITVFLNLVGIYGIVISTTVVSTAVIIYMYESLRKAGRFQ